MEVLLTLHTVAGQDELRVYKLISKLSRLTRNETLKHNKRGSFGLKHMIIGLKFGTDGHLGLCFYKNNGRIKLD